jgi:protein arginine N-methyltransferase 1
MIPRSDALWIAGVQAPEFYQEQVGPWNDRPYDFDMSAARLRTINSISQCWVTAEQLLLEPRCLTTLDYLTLKQTDLDATVSWTVDRASQGHGVVLWFDSVLADGVTLTNRPGAPRLIYKQAFFPWPSPLDVCPGDTVTVTVSARLVGSEYFQRCQAALSPVNFFWV